MFYHYARLKPFLKGAWNWLPPPQVFWSTNEGPLPFTDSIELRMWPFSFAVLRPPFSMAWTYGLQKDLSLALWKDWFWKKHINKSVDGVAHHEWGTACWWCKSLQVFCVGVIKSIAYVPQKFSFQIPISWVTSPLFAKPYSKWRAGWGCHFQRTIGGLCHQTKGRQNFWSVTMVGVFLWTKATSLNRDFIQRLK